MKNVIKLKIWGALIVLASQVSVAETNPGFSVNVTGSKTFELALTNVKGDVNLFLRSEKGTVIYKNTIATNGSFRKSYDMNLFSDGSYVLELTDAEKGHSLPLIIEGNELQVQMEEQKTYFLPVVNQKDELVSVNMMALNGEDLSVTILNPRDEVVYNETLTGNAHIGKIFDFSTTVRGDYEFRLISNGKVITKAVTID